MSISINSNRYVTSALVGLNRVSGQLSNLSNQISSGLRVNRAVDDPAGLSIAALLNSDARIATIAIRNTNDAIYMANIADSSAGSVSDILTRMSELAEQAANGVLSVVQRSSLDKEFKALGSEVERIALTTNYNGINLLSGTAVVAFQVGFQSYSTSQISMTTTQMQLQGLGLANSGSSALIYSLNANTSIDGQVAARQSLDAILSAMQLATVRRGEIGAAQSRLESAVSTLQVSREAFSAAESQIKDLDIAVGAAELVRLKILQQSAVAVLAQAKVQPELARRLIDGI